MPGGASKGHELLEALGLTVVSDGPSGRYPRAEPGPADTFRYRATHANGRYQFGVHAKPKKPLPSDLSARLESWGFALTSDTHVAYRDVGETLGEAVVGARVTMAVLEILLRLD
jgi:hypothetical protein